MAGHSLLNPSPNTLALSHIHAAPSFQPPTQHHSSQPRCRDGGGVTSKGQRPFCIRHDKGGDLGTSLSSRAGGSLHLTMKFLTMGKTNKYFGHHSTLAFLRVNLSRILPPPLQVWSLLDSQNTIFAAITYMATGRAGEVGSEPSFSPGEMQFGASVFPHSGTCGIWEHKREPQDRMLGRSMAGPGPFSAGGEPLPAL